MNRMFTAGCMLALCLFTPLVSAQEKSGDNPAARNMNRDVPRHKEFLRRIEESNGAGDVIFLGDSITNGWENEGKKAWPEYFGSFKPVNLGIGGDQTGHILWRITEVMSDRSSQGCRHYDPPTTGRDSAANRQRHQGDRRGVKRQKPNMKILVLGVFPRGNAGDAGPDR